MKNHRSKNLHLVGFELTLPTVLCIGRQSRGGRTTLAVGYATACADTVVAPLAGEWLARHFRRRFVEHGRGDEGGLAAEALYDKLASLFRPDAPFLAAVVSPPLGASPIPGIALESTGAGKAHLAERSRWNCSGRVRAHHNSKTGIAQVTFDPLPGGIELASADKLAPSGARLFKDAHVISAWWGFGVPIRDPAELVVTLRNSIGELHAPAQRAAHA
jgi:hypothetical protein